MNRKILLIEPNYKNKYPPMGLMKISTYYKKLGDNVTFFKGNLKELVLNDTYESLLEQLYANNNTIFWEKYKPQICNFIRRGNKESFDEIPLVRENPIIVELLKYYRKYFYNKEYFLPENRKWDRVGVTTLFTFYWDITIETINFVKQLCKSENDVMIGGVMASILPDKVEEATGIRPYVGTLSTAGVLDDNDLIIDTLPLDYSILEEIEYEYPASNAYYGYMTRGCVNKCKFCAVPKLEPEYKSHIPISKQIKITNERFGEKKDLLLLDNNVLASCEFHQIIDEIKKAGFTRESNFIPPNMFEIAIKNLKDGYNDKGYIRNVVKQYRMLLDKYGINKMQPIYDLLDEKGLLEFHTAKKETILEIYDEVKDLFGEFYNRKSRKRFVDFNQGIDARLINDENMEKLFEIPIRPVRIAFDSWKLHKVYEKAVRTAVKHGHKELSNYILYNFEDSPVELYKRLRLNVDLCEELGANIYSFPMKYHPIEDPDYFSNRDYIGKHWNRKFIRTIQAILNSTKGKVGKGHTFFCKAFGNNENEFEKLLYMPEAMIIYRLHFENNGLTDKWWSCFSNLSSEKLEIVKPIIEKNSFLEIESLSEDSEILQLLSYYTIKREDAEREMNN
ncbi:hypothetical protein [Clostridium sp. C2-6-12]|uniref:hypothetical protein n=1 Tax=Clostridium sp. C2-6-12 TaxID=2698832 RepID=UPI0013717DA0|nr:hypothetical protein [Clostridium sp. C2-6-12]